MKKRMQKNEKSMRYKQKLLLPLLIAATSCKASELESSESRDVVRASLQFEADGTLHQGTAMLQRVSSGQKFRIFLPEKTELLYLTTCHREEVWKKPPAIFEYRWVPAMWLENWNSCLMTWSAVTQKGNLLQAVVDFTSNEFLNAKHMCNGKYINSDKGASFCQARSGTVQRIEFDVQTIAIAGEGCPDLEKEALAYRYYVAEGLCSYRFGNGKTRHRLTTRGYTALEKE